MGSIKILDLLLEGNLIDKAEYLYCLEEFERHNGNEIRLPQSALQERIDKYRKVSACRLDRERMNRQKIEDE